jgi:hypothetical protein
MFVSVGGYHLHVKNGSELYNVPRTSLLYVQRDDTATNIIE